jgi:hypothetical protein
MENDSTRARIKRYEQLKRANLQAKLRFPEKYAIRGFCIKLPKRDGMDNHHWSYNKDHATDIIRLKIKDHAFVHRFMIYDQERMMYRKPDGTLIDSREAAIAYYKSLKAWRSNPQSNPKPFTNPC